MPKRNPKSTDSVRRLRYRKGYGPVGDKRRFDRTVIRAATMWGIPCYDAQCKIVKLLEPTHA